MAAPQIPAPFRTGGGKKGESGVVPPLTPPAPQILVVLGAGWARKGS